MIIFKPRDRGGIAAIIGAGIWRVAKCRVSVQLIGHLEGSAT